MKYLLLIITMNALNLAAQTDLFVTYNSTYKLQTEYKTPIYSIATLDSKNIMDYYNNGSNSRIIAENRNWLKIRYWVNDSTRSIGFINKQKTYIKQYYAFYNHLITVSPKKWDANNNKQFIVSFKHYKTDSILDTLILTNFYHGEHFYEQKYKSGLKNVNKLIRFQTYRESCPGLTENDFIILVNNKLKSIIKETSTGEIGWESEMVYQPIQFGNGQIKMLYLDSDSEIVNRNTGELNEFKNADKFNIPLAELIIKKISIGDPVIKNDDYLMDENDEYIIEESSQLEIYRWNGTEIKLVKKIKL